MPTVEAIIKDISAISPKRIPQVAIAKWLDNRYQELVSKSQFKHLRKVGELYMSAVVDDGTIDATRGSTSITGTDTTWATSPGVASHTQWFFRTRTAWYKIASVTNDTTLTLSTEFAEDDVDDGSYNIVRRYYSLESDARWLGVFVFPRLRYKIRTISSAELDISQPGRILAEGYPLYVTQRGVDSSNYLEVEFYPTPSNTELVRYVYWSLPSNLEILSTIPPQIDAYTLKEGAIIDLYRYLKVRSLEEGQIEAAGVYANEEAKQRTIWKKAIQDAVRTSRGVDDAQFIIEDFGGIRTGYEITDAHDQVYANWSR
jgi:hypothetical protein